MELQHNLPQIPDSSDHYHHWCTHDDLIQALGQSQHTILDEFEVYL